MLYTFLSALVMCIYFDPTAWRFWDRKRKVRLLYDHDVAWQEHHRLMDAAKVAKMRNTRAHDKLVWDHKRALIERINNQRKFSLMWDGAFRANR